MGRIPAFWELFASLLAGREVYAAALVSQVISNVPAALLLSGFTDNARALLIGTNLGGLGTLIASMASLISYKSVSYTHLLLVPQLVPHDVPGGFQLPQRTADGINALLADFRKSTGSIVPVIRQG